MTIFYDNLKRICESRGTSIEKVAFNVGYNPRSAYNWSSAKGAPVDDVLVAFAEELGCKVSDFFKDEREREWADELAAYESIRAEAEGDLDESERDLLKLYGELSKKDRTRFMAMAYEFAEEHGVEL